MSYNVYFEVNTGAGQMVDIADRDCTRNVAPMWCRALGTEGTARLSDVIREHPKARDLGPIIRAAAERMRSTGPEAYADLEPSNGWGDYESALGYLEWIADMCEQHPAAVVSVSC